MVVGLSIWEMRRGAGGGSNCCLLLLHGYSERGSQTWCTLERWRTMDTIWNKRASAWLEGRSLPHYGGETLGRRPKRRWDLHLQRYSPPDCTKALSDVIQLCSDPWLNERPLGSTPTKTFL